MRHGSLQDLRPVSTRVVIINLHTDLVATRALLSATTATDLAVVLVNADPTPASSAHFDRLAQRVDFDIVDVPASHHGRFLDRLFATSGDGSILLLDSDAEIRDPAAVAWMLHMLALPGTFGAGWLEGPFWMDGRWSAPERSMLFMERPWVPCLLLEVAAVRLALDAGRHFGEEMVPNELAISRRLAWKLASRFGPPYGPSSPALHRLPDGARRWFAGRRLDFLERTRHPYYGLRPKIACYDTAGRIYEHLRFNEGLAFAGVDVRLSEGKVHHYGGITRNAVFGPTVLDRSEDDVASDARRRLREHYGVDWPLCGS